MRCVLLRGACLQDAGPVDQFEGFLVDMKVAASSHAINLSVALKRPDRSFRVHDGTVRFLGTILSSFQVQTCPVIKHNLSGIQVELEVVFRSLSTRNLHRTGIVRLLSAARQRHYYQLLHQLFTLQQPAIQIACLD